MTDPARRERILAALIREYRDEGHTIITEESDVLATVMVKSRGKSVPAVTFNLSTLADQIDRSVK